jgi:hypothetical protein
MGEDLAAANVNRSYLLGGDEHRDFHIHAVLSVPEVRERHNQPLIVSVHTDRDGCRGVLIRVRDAPLLPVLAWRTNK